MTTNQSIKITTSDIFFFLRQRLVDAREQNDENALDKLQVTFDVLMDLAYIKKNRAIGKILEEFEISARDASMGVSWKSAIPSESDIRLALDSEETY